MELLKDIDKARIFKEYEFSFKNDSKLKYYLTYFVSYENGEITKTTSVRFNINDWSISRDVSNKVIFMDNGYICEEGRPEDIFNNPQQERTKEFLKRYIKA